MPHFQIAIGQPIHPEQDMAVDALTELLGFDVEQQKLPGLAGPNELMHFLGDAETWQLFLGAIATAFGSAFTARIGSNLADDLYRKKADIARALVSLPVRPIKRMIASIQQARAKDNTVLAAIPHRINPARNVGLVITADAPGDIVSQMITFAGKARAIEAFMDHIAAGNKEFLLPSTNPDRSTRIEIDANGKIVIPASYQFVSAGQRVSQRVRIVLN